MKPNMGALLSVGSCDCIGHTPMELILTGRPLLNKPLALTTAYADASKYPAHTSLPCSSLEQPTAGKHSLRYSLASWTRHVSDLIILPPSTPPKLSLQHSQIQGTATLSTEGPIAEAVLAFELFLPCVSRQAASLRRPIPTAGRAALPWFLRLLPGFRPHQSLSARLGSQFCPPLTPAPQGHQDHFKASHPAPCRKPLGAFPAFANSFIIWVLPLFRLSASHLLFLSHSVSLHLANRLLSETQPGSTPSQSAFTATSLSAHGVMTRLSDKMTSVTVPKYLRAFSGQSLSPGL